jgi:hypothetical protein
MGRKYTKRLSKRLSKRRKNTLKSRVSKRLKVSKRKNSLNRRKNTVRRLKKKRTNKKRLFKGGAKWKELHPELSDLLNTLNDDESAGATEVKQQLYLLIVGNDDYPPDSRLFLLNMTTALDNMDETKCNSTAPLYITSIKDFYD